MSIRTKTFLTVAFTLLFLLAALYGLLSRFLMEGFRQVETQNARKDVSRALDGIQARMDAMEGSVFTWSQWDDSFQFIQDKNEDFIKSNISPTLFTGMKVNFFLYVTPEHTVLLDGGYDILENKDLPVPAELRQWAAQKEHPLWQNTDVNHSVKGLLDLPEHPLLVVSAPITNTPADAPAKGFVVFARYLDGAEIGRLSDVTHLELELDRNHEALKDIRITPKNSEIVEGKTVLLDLQSNPVGHLTAQIPRSIYQEGQKTLRYLLYSVIAVGLLFGLVVIFLLERLVLRRLLRLDSEVQSITGEMTFDRFVSVDGKDEITSLSNAVNGMIAAVSELLHSLPENKEKK